MANTYVENNKTMSTYNLSWPPVAYISLFFMLLAQTVVAVETVLGFGVHLIIYLYVQSLENLTSALKTADTCIMPVVPTMYLLAPVRLRCHMILMNLHLCCM